MKLSTKTSLPNSVVTPTISKAIFVVLVFTTLLTRVLYLGYGTLYHGEAENAQFVVYVMPYLTQYNFFVALWKAWHLFINGENPWAMVLPVNVPLSWFFGITEFTVRLNAVLGGLLSAIIVFFLIKRNSNYVTALIALALFSLNPYLIAFHRFGFVDSLQVACVLCGVLLIDAFQETRKIYLLLFASLFFSIAIITKSNAIIMIAIFLILYCYFRELRLRDLFISAFFSVVIMHLMFIDQLDLFYGSMLKQALWSTMNAQVLSGEIRPRNALDVLDFSKNWWCEKDCGARINVRWHLEYWELTVAPLLICLVIWKRIDNKFFKLLTVTSVLYFLILLIQGRYFYRYMQLGVISTTMAFAFPLHYVFHKYRKLFGVALLLTIISWNLFVHRSYPLAIYHYIPYEIIKDKIDSIRGNGRIFIYGRNSESEYYLSKSQTLLLDESVDLSAVKNPAFRPDVDSADRQTQVRRMPPTREALIDRDDIVAGDVIVVHGMQMRGGEPAIRLGKPKLNRSYEHDIFSVQQFYDQYWLDTELLDRYELVETINLANGSDKLAALILKRK